jgi:hypothetical protein
MTQFVSHSAWYVYLLCFLAATGITAFLYFRNPSNKEVPKFWNISLQLCRFLSVLLLLLLLCDFFFKTILRQNERPLLLVAIDNSASMLAGKDSAQVLSFVKNKLPQAFASLEEIFELSVASFGSGFQNKSTNTFSDKASDFENLFQEMETRYANRNVGAAILVSDGIQNKGVSPLLAAERAGYPIYCIAVGDTTEFRDLKISKISHNQITYLGNAFPVDVFVQASKLKGKQVVLKLMQDGKEKARSNISITGDQFSATIGFTLNAETTGINVYTTQLEVLREEKNLLNNSREFVIEVQDKRQKILLLAQTPHPDVNALRESLLSNSAYELDTRFTDEFSGNLKAYNLLILHGASSAQKPLIEQCLAEGVPFWIVRPATQDVFPGLRLNASTARYNDSEPLINGSFGLFTLNTNLQNFLASCPAVKCAFGKNLLSNSASCLLYQKIGNVETTEPLFVFNESSGIKSACFNGDGLWKWKMRDFSEHASQALFNELVFATVHYLSVKNDKSQFRLRYPKLINENETLELEAEVYNKSYEAIHSAEVSVALRNSKNETFKYSFSSNGRFYQAALGALPADVYEFTATSKAGDEVLQKSGRLVVREMLAEQQDVVANHRLLYQIASRSGGALYGMNGLETLKTDLLNKKDIKTITYAISSLNRLIDWPLLFFALLLTFGLEWGIRKRYLNI